MDATTAKAFTDALFKYAESKTGNPLLQTFEKAANSALDTLIDEFLASPAGQQFAAKS